MQDQGAKSRATIKPASEYWLTLAGLVLASLVILGIVFGIAPLVIEEEANAGLWPPILMLAILAVLFGYGYLAPIKSLGAAGAATLVLIAYLESTIPDPRDWGQALGSFLIPMFLVLLAAGTVGAGALAALVRTRRGGRMPGAGA